MTDESIHWPSQAASDFEDQHGIDVIEMRDFGSRANNMDGPNSDIDAMFIFDQPAMDSKLDNYVDTIDTEMYGIDFHGWNIQKFRDLLADSNPQAIDFLNSDIQYYTTYPTGPIHEALEELRRYANRNFNPIRLYMHNRSKAESNYEKYILRKLINRESNRRYHIVGQEHDRYLIDPIDEPDEEHKRLESELREHLDDLTHRNYSIELTPQRGYEITGYDEAIEEQGYIPAVEVGDEDHKQFRFGTTDRTIRRNLKVIHAILCARHIRRTKSLPPMDFDELLEHHISPEIQARVEDLLIMKQEGDGDMEAGNPFDDLIEYEINREVDYEDLKRSGIDRERVNEFVREIDDQLYR